MNSSLAAKLSSSILTAVMAWIFPISVFTLGTLTMEIDMQIHVKMMCVVSLAAAWARFGKKHIHAR